MVSQTIGSFVKSSIVRRTPCEYHDFVDESPAIVSERSTDLQVQGGIVNSDGLNLGWILQIGGRVAKLGGGACISTLSEERSESGTLALLSVVVLGSLES